MQRLREDILRVADLNVPVLIRGETGTGKELVAQALHTVSPRNSRAYISVNMAAVPGTTAASELFGHARGAFTGAHQEHAGYFAKADRGTLFLDEIGEAPADVQVMMLRVLESGEIQPLGSSRRQTVDVRVIAATDMDLEAAIRDGQFRGPLLHRLAGYELNLPALRERKGDIPRLLLHFLRRELEVLGEVERLEQNPRLPWLPASLVSSLLCCAWPGNVRQLANVARQLVISNRGAACLRVDKTLTRLLSQTDVSPRPLDTPEDSGTGGQSAGGYRSPDDVTEDELCETLRANSYRVRPTAVALGLSKTSLYALMEKSDRIRKAVDITAEEVIAARGVCGDDLEAIAMHLEVSKRGLQFRLKDLGI